MQKFFRQLAPLCFIFAATTAVTRRAHGQTPSADIAWAAAVRAGLVSAEQEAPVFRRALAAAFSVHSPMHAHERLLLWLGTLPMASGERVDVPLTKICAFYENFNAAPEMQNESAWLAQLFLNENFYEQFFYDDPRDKRQGRECGTGSLRAVVVEGLAAGEQALELYFSKDLNFKNTRLDLVLKSGSSFDGPGATKGIRLLLSTQTQPVRGLVQRLFEQRDKVKFNTRLSNYNDFAQAQDKPVDRAALERAQHEFLQLWQRYRGSKDKNEDLIDELTAAARTLLDQHGAHGYTAGYPLLRAFLTKSAAAEDDLAVSFSAERGRLEVGSGRGSARYSLLAFWLPAAGNALVSASEVSNSFIGNLQRASGAFFAAY